MNIVKAKMEDSTYILSLIKQCVEVMNRRGNDQWDEYYPNMDVINDDIESGDLYILKDNHHIQGIITLNDKQEKEYLDIQWEYSEGRQLIVHRLAISPNYQGRGLGDKLMQFAEEKARELGYDSIRLDTYVKNKKAIYFYEARDYIKRGNLYFSHRKDPFIAFEKKL
ncbi:GNAT family N-acetyltransferase [Vallitalea okinawensis]|uniref:GNAT family N-acetyltransferase n=1 Tax=Vallitalea okinawensis TaxID=2078660 RepID=UPI000CFC6026|nr:GNAT family N-acetyltransferase [Vallitalea okinawensis]